MFIERDTYGHLVLLGVRLINADRLRRDFFPPIGDEQSLEKVCNEIRRFSRGVRWSDERITTLVATINDIASSFRQGEYLETVWPAESRTELRHGLQKILAAIEQLERVVAANLRSLERAGHYYKDPGRRAEFACGMSDISGLRRPFAAALASHEFQRKGRAKSPVGAHVALVLSTRELMEHFAGHPPGFSRETDASPGPLVRTVKAIYLYATGKPPERTFDSYIAQAEQLSKKKAASRLEKRPHCAKGTRRH